MLRYKVVIVGCVLVWSCPRVATAESGGLSLSLEIARKTIVAREPVKFRVTLTNESDIPARIMSVERLSTSMQFMDLLVRTPGSVPARLNFQWEHRFEYFPDGYKGEVLAPHESIETFVYPNVATNLETHAFAPTFGEEGEYEVHVVYCIPAWLTYLDGAGKDVVSNPVTVVVTRPTPVEKEILDACWSEGGAWISAGETLPIPGPDAALTAVIDKYPGERMTQYARLLLAKSLTALVTDETVWNEHLTRAADTLESLRSQAPDFRKEEVLTLLAMEYQRLGEANRARATYAEAIKQDSLLTSNYLFMRHKVVLDRGKISDWLQKRSASRAEQPPKEE